MLCGACHGEPARHGRFQPWEERGHGNLELAIGSDTLVEGFGGSELGTLVDSEAGQLIAKACWNLFLIEGDGSDGVHNPSFVLDVIQASVDALQ